MDALTFFDVAANAGTTTVAIGTVAPGSSDDTQLRVYNNSDLYQAEDVTVSLDGPNQGQLYLSADGDVFTTSVDVGDIPPGAYSPPFWLRRVTAHMVANGSYSATLLATPAAWTSPTDAGTSANVPLDTSDS